MSWQATAWAQTVKVGNPCRKSVLIAMANYANDGGNSIYPSVATICQITELSERAVQGHLKELVNLGFLIITAEPAGKAKIYRVPLDQTPAGDAPPQNLHPRRLRHKPPQEMHPTPAGDAPNPLEEPIKEPLNSCAEKKSTRKNTSEKDNRDQEFLDRIKAEFPKRDGGHGWAKAESKIKGIPLKDRDAVISGVIGYRQWLSSKGKEGTEFVRQATTFFNQETWKEYQPKQEKPREWYPDTDWIEDTPGLWRNINTGETREYVFEN